MQVVFHLGAHCTDEDGLIRALGPDRGRLKEAGVSVPEPARYRMKLRDALYTLKGAPADSALQQEILTAAGHDSPPKRLVFSHEFFTCLPDRVVTKRGFYQMVPDKLGPLANLFPEAQVEFHMALINPAVLMPALVARQRKSSYEELIAGQDPRSLRWAPVVRRMVEAAEGRPLILWCNEDMPLIWPEILRSLTGLNEGARLSGDEALLEQIIEPEGLERLHVYLRSHPPRSATQRRKVVTAFLEKFARPETLEIDISLPGWDAGLIAAMTADYDADIAEIAAMPGVRFIAS
ncbi:hypothetical protein [Sedimentimonas flavescens]|uniref:hypothetical protein n=1 Tax=Sedimentimonas flavescens TaxID=2851012 RepID=UPI001C4A0046|nr:hypothetical protein [Sedimentimonas flavescens]MBW0159129.1 hypothetical protein [Sedimentimonas flavescens]